METPLYKAKLPKLSLPTLFQKLFNVGRISGIMLLVVTLVSLVIANTGGDAYAKFWDRHIDLSFSIVELDYSLLHWINDGLMTIFFVMVGLEIEREFLKGELSSREKAVLPAVAAIGGMVVPAAIFFIFNAGTETSKGIGIPMATDIAFVIGMMALLGKRVPSALKVFLIALAIVDDIGAVLLIAIFYTDNIKFGFLGSALGIFALLLLLRWRKVHHLAFYLVPGILLWYCMLKSGVHATVAGVLLAFTIPFAEDDKKNPSYKVLRALHKPVLLFIMPLFALANTAIAIESNWYQQLVEPLGLGIVLGLCLGKPLGLFLSSWIMIKLNKSNLPDQTSWQQILGAGFLAGIGFTMSIFISNQAFSGQEQTQLSKVSILVASLISCVSGLGILYFSGSNKKA